MRAVMPTALPDVLALRRRTGADQWDEMWDGELHMAPSPNRQHQDFEGALESWLRLHWARPTGGRVYHQINVSEPGAWPKNYRIPDLVLLTPERFGIDRNEYFEGGPDAAVEIHSPGDEAYEKLDFYALVGVREAWIIDRDSKHVELYEPNEGGMRLRPVAADGWVSSDVAGVQMRSVEGGKLEIRLAGRDDTRAQLP